MGKKAALFYCNLHIPGEKGASFSPFLSLSLPDKRGGNKLKK